MRRRTSAQRAVVYALVAPHAQMRARSWTEESRSASAPAVSESIAARPEPPIADSIALSHASARQTRYGSPASRERRRFRAWKSAPRTVSGSGVRAGTPTPAVTTETSATAAGAIWV